MRYVEFRERIREALTERPAGLTWKELKEQLDLPYDQPCQTWVYRLEEEIGLSRAYEGSRAKVWKILA